MMESNRIFLILSDSDKNYIIFVFLHWGAWGF
jgi:hypothetical protein